MLNLEQINALLANTPTGFLKPDDDFFKNSNDLLLEPYKKLGAITDPEDEVCNKPAATSIYCNIAGCQETFEHIASYQRHYNTIHRFHCAECKKSLPTEHLLDMHLSEQHDSFFAARAARGDPVYECFLEECKGRFHTAAQRKEHSIKEHKFPGNYRFDEFCQKKITSTSKNNKNDIDVPAGEDEMDTDFNENNSKRKAYSFGHQKVPTFQTKVKKNQKGNKSLEQMDTLKQVLEEI